MEMDVKKEAIKLFNETWDLIDLKERTDEQKADMLHKAHASRHLWGQVGEPVNFARGEWQVSRCYSLLNMGEPALLHANISLKLALDNALSALDISFGHEAIARAYAILGDKKNAILHKGKGLEASKDMEENDKAYTQGEINSIEI